jgi:hypothetical protein
MFVKDKTFGSPAPDHPREREREREEEKERESERREIERKKEREESERERERERERKSEKERDRERALLILFRRPVSGALPLLTPLKGETGEGRSDEQHLTMQIRVARQAHACSAVY